MSFCLCTVLDREWSSFVPQSHAGEGAREIILSWWGFKSMKSIINKSLGGTASGLMSDQAYALPSKKCPGPGLLQTYKLVAQ